MASSLVLLLALLSTPGEATPEAEQLARRSIIEYNGGEFEQALADVKRAYDIQPAPGLLFDLGQCHRALHHWEQAEFFFLGYLREKPDAPNRAVAEGLVAQMRQSRSDELAAQHQGAPVVDLVSVPLVDSSAVPEAALEVAAPRHRIPTAAWAFGGTGLVVGIGGAIAWGLAAADRSGYSGSAGRQPLSYSQFQQANSAAVIGDILVPVGAVLLATGAAFALFGRSHPVATSWATSR
jgi:tetratricopeptide (TPR) repeat protein